MGSNPTVAIGATVYIDESYLQSVYGSTFVAAMSPSAGELAASIELAEGELEGALTVGGYSDAVPSSVYTDTDDVPKLVKAAAQALWWRIVHGIRGIALPEPLPANIKEAIENVEKIRLGTLEVPGLTRSTTRGPAGVLFTESDPDVTDSRPAVFDRDGMDGAGY